MGTQSESCVRKTQEMVHEMFDPGIAYDELPMLPPPKKSTETLEILRAETRAIAAVSELKGIAHIIPNQSILINAIVLQEAKDSSEIENIITTRDTLYKAFSVTTKKTDPAAKEVLYYREALVTVNLPGPTQPWSDMK